MTSPEESPEEKDNSKLYKTNDPTLQFLHKDLGRICFINKRLRTSDPKIIAFLDSELEAGNKTFRKADPNEPDPIEPGSDLELMKKQIEEFRKSQTNHVDIPEVPQEKLKVTSTQDSPLTGGPNPIAPKFVDAVTKSNSGVPYEESGKKDTGKKDSPKL